MSYLKTVESTGCNCSSCGERIRKCEKLIQVCENNGKSIRGERYCTRCESCAIENNEVDPEFPYAQPNNEVERMRDFEREREAYADYLAAGCPQEFWNDRDAGYI